MRYKFFCLPNVKEVVGLPILLLALFMVPWEAKAQCNFTATVSSSTYGCFRTEADAVLVDLVNNSATGNSLTKTGGGNSWNGGAASTAAVYDNGFVQTTVAETNTSRMIGLSTTNSDANYTTIQYAVYLRNDGIFFVYESGINRGSFGTYNSGDIMQLRVVQGRVRYLLNGVVFYISNVAPTLPLIMDASINTVGGTLNTIIISNLTDGNFTTLVSAPGAGAGPVYQWKLNGANVGGNSPSYSNAALNANDQIICTLTPGGGGCSGVPVTSNQIVIKAASYSYGNFYVTPTAAVSACYEAKSSAVWNPTAFENVFSSGTALTKIQGGSAWDGGAASFNKVSNNGYLQFTATETNTYRMIGLSNTNVDGNYLTIQYAIYLLNNGNVNVYESGANRGNFGTYATNDVFKVTVESGVVKYYQNGNLLYISAVAPTLPLLADVSIYSQGGTVSNLILSNPVTDTFTATATNVGGSPIYQWKLNGANVGANSPTYTNASLSNSDVITCEITPSHSNCSAAVYSSVNSITVSSLPAPANVDFYIVADNSTSACNTGTEQVVWQIGALNNVERSGNNLTKIQSGGWDGGAASFNTVKDNGYMEFTATEVDRARMVGLSTTNTDNNYTTIQYAVYVRNDANFFVYESGVSRGGFGIYAVGDKFRIVVDNGVVKYYRNGTLFYISTIAPTLPLLVDVSIRDVGGTVTNAVVSNLITSTFTATATNVGSNPVYQWKLNGANVGANSTTYVNASLANNDVITCEITPDLGSCSATIYTSNSVTVNSIPAPTNVDFYIQSSASASACKTGTEQVSWRYASLGNNMVRSGNNLTKFQGGNGWDGGAASFNTVSNNGFMQFTATETTTNRMIGLSTANADANYTSIQYAVYLTNGGNVQIYESGTFRGTFGTYTTNDIFKVTIESNVVKYYRNGVLFYISTVSPTLPMLVDVSFNTVGSTISNVLMSNIITDTFTATATNLGASPIYQWKLNGVNVGINSTTYVNNALANTDVITCVITPDLGSCSATTYTSNSITIADLPAPANVDFYITASNSPSACNTGTEQVVWQIGSLNNVQRSGNNLTKIQSGGWDGGAASFNTVKDNGYFEFTASETNLARMIGLSNTNVDNDWTTIQYTFYLVTDGSLQIREGGTNRGTFGVYTTSDKLKITVESGVVKYYINGTLLYISTIAPTLPLLVDVSIRDVGGTVTNAVVSNLITSTFTATATNVGSNPVYQWKLNGANVGANSTTYVNASLANNDVITCEITPDLGSCSATIYTSNSVTVNSIPASTNVDFYIQSSASASACKTGTEQVSWRYASLGNNMVRSGNNLTKFQGGNGWDGGAASFNTVSNNGFMQFTATETNTHRMMGLSNTNADANYTSIQYAIYLVNNGTVQIYESGSGRGAFGSYATSDIFKITVENNVVKYYQNGTLLYISTVAPTLPLLADVSIYSVGATISNVLVSNIITDTFTATATNLGASPIYQWKLNGVNVGINSTTYVNNALANTDVITCVITPDLGSCSATTYTSNNITIADLPAPANVDFYITASNSPSACNTGTEQVVWQVGSLNNVQRSGNNLTKIQSGGWDGGAASFNTVKDNGYMEFTATEVDRARMVGLSTTNTDNNYTTIQYAVYVRNDANFFVYESGVSRGGFGIYAVGDKFRIVVDNGVVKYYRNGTLFYISTIAPTLPLLVDVSIRDVGGTVTNVVVSNLITSTFTATATNVGSNPVYQWKLNGANVGANSTTYVNASLANNDVVTCEITPDLGSCSATIYTSNSVTVNSIPAPTNVDFYIQASASASACKTGTEQVSWQYASLGSNVIRNGNSLTKFQGGSAWNGGAVSFNTVSNNGFMQFTATETNTYRAIGLSNINIDANYTTIQYVFYLANNGTVQIFESGIGRGTFGSYSTSDIFKITVESGVVKYYQNGALLYISTITPTLPLLVDVSMYTVGSTLNDVLVSNIITDTFTATTTNLGSSPTYQWKLNGVNVGGNSPTYVNNALANTDVITCVITPDLGSCSTTTYTSNSITIADLPAPANVDFYIMASNSPSACNTGTEQVVWQVGSLNNVQRSGNNLTKIQSNGTWDGGAASFNTVKDNGYMEFTATEVDRARMVGLSTTNTDNNYTTIQYAVYVRNDANFFVYESGVSRGNFGVYVASDKFRIAVDNGVVKYYRNGTLFYISTIAPTLPLLVDVSIRDTGGTVTNAVVSNLITSTFTATATNVGSNPVYQWKLNGANVGTNSTTYVNASLVNNDVVACEIIPDLGSCSTTIYTSNSVTITTLAAAPNIDFYVRSTAAASACQTGTEQVVWQNASLGTNMIRSGNNLTKFQGSNAWDGGAASFNTVSNNGFMQFTATETNTHRMIGLSNTNADANYTSIQFAIYLVNNGTVQVYESGASRGTFGTYTTNDIFKVTIESGVVKYYKNGTLFYISAVVPTLPLLVDVSINTVGGTISTVQVSNPITSTFTATATNAGASPTYQWKLNGVNVGTNSSSYVNASLTDADVITCVLTPDLGSCSTSSYTSNSVTIATLPAPANIDFDIQGTFSSSACQDAIEQVVWQKSSLANLQATGNSLNKVQSNGNWDGGAASLNTVKNNGYLEFTATETNTSRMIGLSTTNVNANYTTIQYAIYLINSGAVQIYESGSGRGGFGTYSAGDVFKVSVDNNVVRYFKNGILLYTSGVAPTLPLIVDVSINTSGGTISNAKVANQTLGTFTATATNAGVAPSYQWKLNGGNVGTNSITYSNGGLNNGDVITCVLTPDLGSCNSSTYTSNSATIYKPGSTTTWTGVTNTSWDVAGNWSSGIPDRYKAVTIPSGTPNSPVISVGGNVYDITINAGAILTMSGSSTFTLYRNWTNNGTFTPATSTVSWVGCATTNTISSAATETFYRVVMNNSNGATVSTSTQQISNNLTLTNGIITNSSLIQFADNATVTSASNASHVAGQVRKVGNDAFTFPVGKSGFYRPITMSAPGNVADHFTAEYFRTPQTFGSSAQAPIDHVSGCEYWNLNRTNGASNVTVTLSWNEAACNVGDITVLADLRVAQWNGTQWLNKGNGGTTGNGVSGTIISSGVVNTFGPFTLGSTTLANPLPIELVAFEANVVDREVMFKWVTASELNNDFFTIDRSSDGETFATIVKVPGAGTSSQPRTYHSEDHNPLPGRSYYRLAQTDYDGSTSYSQLVQVDIQQIPNGVVAIYPNPVNNSENLTIEYFANDEDQVSIIIFDTAGRLVQEELATVKQGSNAITFVTDFQTSGLYLIQIRCAGNTQSYRLGVR